MNRSFTYARTVTKGLMAFGFNGFTDHFASRAQIQRALTDAETSVKGEAELRGLTLHEDDLRLLLLALGSDAA